MGAYVCTHAEPDLFARSKLPQLCGGHIELLAHVRSRPTGHGRARCCCAARVLRKRYGVLLAAATAQLLTAAISEEPLSSSDEALLRAFNWSRFAERDQPSTRQP